MNKLNKITYEKLQLLSKEVLYDILTKAGINFPSTKKEDLSQEELLLVADEADQKILEDELNYV